MTEQDRTMTDNSELIARRLESGCTCTHGGSSMPCLRCEAAQALRDVQGTSLHKRLTYFEQQACVADRTIESLQARIAELEAFIQAEGECHVSDAYVKKLEGALKEIVRCTPANKHKEWPHHHHYLFIAEQALKGD